MPEPQQTQPASLTLADQGTSVRLSGAWTLNGIMKQWQRLDGKLRNLPQAKQLIWDLSQVDALDTAGALLLWRAWGRKYPDQLVMPDELATLFQILESKGGGRRPASRRVNPIAQVWQNAVGITEDIAGILAIIGRSVLDLYVILRHPALIPWREISATIYKTGPLALVITGLVGFLIGVVVAYQSALQLAAYGANIYIVNLLGLGVLRELGPLLAAIIVAGRSGSAFTAQLGVMKVTEEIDALQTFGVSPTIRLILPKIIAMAFTLPLIVLWTDTIAIAGGIWVAKVQLSIPPDVFLDTLPKVVPEVNFWIGLSKGVAFGALIAVIACYYGLKVEPNTESLSRETTNAVVMAITAVILTDAAFAMALSDVGLY